MLRATHSLGMAVLLCLAGLPEAQATEPESDLTVLGSQPPNLAAELERAKEAGGQAQSRPLLEPPDLFGQLATEFNGDKFELRDLSKPTVKTANSEVLAFARHPRYLKHEFSSERVGALGDPKLIQIVFENRATFSSGQIQKALQRNLGVALSAVPAGELSHYLNMLGWTVGTGYFRAGFAAVQVDAEVSPERDRIVLTITEGPRYQMGDIKVHGTSFLDNGASIDRAIAAALTAPRSKSERAELSAGTLSATKILRPSARQIESSAPRPLCALREPIEADWVTLQALERCAELTCGELGFPFAKVSVAWWPAGYSTANLEVFVKDIGPRAKFTRLRVEGDERASESEVTRFLGLEPGDPLPPTLLTQVAEKLVASGYCSSAEASLEMADDGGVDLVVRLGGSRGLPPLSETLSAADAAILRFGRWLAQSDKWSEDMVIETETPLGRAEVTLAPSGAMAVSLNEATPDRFMAVVDVGQIALYSGRSNEGWKWAASPSEAAPLDFSLRLETVDSDRTVGVRFVPSLGPTASPRIDLRPSTWLELLRNPFVTAELSDGRWTITDPRGYKLVFEDATGRGLRLQVWSSDTEATDDKARLSVRWEDGAFDRRRRDFSQAIANLRNECDEANPVASLAEFLAMEAMARSSPCSPDSRRLFGRMLSSFVSELSPSLPRLLPERTEGNSFTIPREPEEYLGSTHWQIDVLELANDLFARETAAGGLVRGLSRSACRAWLQGEWQEATRRFGSTELHDLLHGDAPGGPLVGLVLSELSDKANITEFALAQLEGVHWRRDCAGVIDRRGLVGRALCEAAETLRTSEPTAALGLLEIIPAEQRVPFTHFVEELQADKDRPIDAALLDALECGWSNGWRELIESELRSIEKGE